MKKKILILVAIFLFGCTFGIIKTTSDPVTRLVVTPESLHLAPGEGAQLTVTGYTESGAEATEKQMERLRIIWYTKSEGGVFAVDESGNLTAICEGIGNVSVGTRRGMNSRPITVYVE